MKVSLQSNIVLFPLTIRKDKRNYIVEEPISGDFFEMPELAVDAIQRMEKGEGLAAIEEVLKHEHPGEEVDMVEFVEQLMDLGLVKELDGVRVSGEEEKRAASQSKASGFSWIPARVGRVFFNPVMNKFYLFLLVINVVILILNPSLFPHYRDIFLFDSMMLNLITYASVSLVLILIHEFGHIVAIRSHDLPAQLSIGNRLIFIVFQTDLTQAWKLAPKQRNILYLAGMAVEQVIIFLAFVLLLLFPNANIAGLFSLIVLDIFIKTIYQCCFYMKTDMYYVVENVTGNYNLMESGQDYLRSLFKRDKDRGKNSQQAFQDNWNVIRMYSVFYVVGVLLTLLLAAVYFLPQVYYAYATILSNIFSPSNDAAYWDAILFLTQTVIMVGLLIYLTRRKRV